MVEDRSVPPSASVTTVSMAPDSVVHVPDTQVTSIFWTTVFGSERATAATASWHRSAGTPLHDTAGEAGGPPLPAGAAHDHDDRDDREDRDGRRRRRSVVGATSARSAERSSRQDVPAMRPPRTT